MNGKRNLSGGVLLKTIQIPWQYFCVYDERVKLSKEIIEWKFIQFFFIEVTRQIKLCDT